MSNNLPNSKNDGFNRRQSDGDNKKQQPSPLEPTRRDIQKKVDKILNK